MSEQTVKPAFERTFYVPQKDLISPGDPQNWKDGNPDGPVSEQLFKAEIDRALAELASESPVLSEARVPPDYRLKAEPPMPGDKVTISLYNAFDKAEYGDFQVVVSANNRDIAETRTDTPASAAYRFGG